MGIGPMYGYEMDDATRQFLENEKRARQKRADKEKRKGWALALRRKFIPVKRDGIRT